MSDISHGETQSPAPKREIYRVVKLSFSARMLVGLDVAETHEEAQQLAIKQLTDAVLPAIQAALPIDGEVPKGSPIMWKIKKWRVTFL